MRTMGLRKKLFFLHTNRQQNNGAALRRVAEVAADDVGSSRDFLKKVTAITPRTLTLSDLTINADAYSSPKVLQAS